MARGIVTMRLSFFARAALVVAVSSCTGTLSDSGQDPGGSGGPGAGGTNSAGGGNMPQAGEPGTRVEGTLPTGITASRISGVAPLAVLFRQPGPITHEYEWTFGEGEGARGLVASHVYDKPGTYKARVVERKPGTKEFGVAEVTITVSEFTGSTFYVDADSGSDDNDGKTPATAWRNATKFDQHVNSLPANERANLRYLLKRGQTHTVGEDGRWVFLREVPGPIRFGTYANADGSDDPTQPRPIIQDNPVRVVGYARGNPDNKWSLVKHLVTVKDVVYENIEFRGNYEYVPPPGVTSTRFDYPTDALDLLSSHDILIRNVEVHRMCVAVQYQAEGTNLFVHDSHIHDNLCIVIFGHVQGYSLRDNVVERSTEGHLHYVGPEDGVITGNVMRGSGIDQVDGDHRWTQCTLRLNSDEQVKRVYVANNQFSEFTGTGLCIGQNQNTAEPSEQIVIERNIFDGVYPEGGDHWTEGPVVTIDPAREVIFRNNALLNTRGPIDIGPGNPDRPSSRNIRILNNLISGNPSGPVPVLALLGDRSTRDGVVFKNNIVTGGYTAILSHRTTGSGLVSGLAFDHNIYEPSALSLWLPDGDTDFGTWQSAHGQDASSSIGVQSCIGSLTPSDPNFLKPCPTSPAIDAGEVVESSSDYRGELRPRDGNSSGSAEWDIGPYEQ